MLRLGSGVTVSLPLRMRSDLTSDLDGGVRRALAVGTMTFLVVEVERRDASPKHVHRLGVFRHVLHAGDDLTRYFVVGTDVLCQIIELFLLWQTTVPKQKNDLLKGRMLRQIVNVVTLID